MDGATQNYAKDLDIHIISCITAKTSILCLIINNKKNVTFMEYEQKYNAALERAKEYHDNGGAPLILEAIFPELKESEDGENKRISKEITKFLKQNNGWNREWLAWIEKQGQVKESLISQHEIEMCKENDDSLTSEDERIKETLKEFVKGYSAFINGQWRLGDFTVNRLIAWLEKQGWLEKQCEQPTDKVEPKFKAGDYIVPDNITPLEIWRVINIDEDGYYNVQSITNPEDDEIYRVPAFTLEKDYYNLDNVKKRL